jgi:hypothetical protein
VWLLISIQPKFDDSISASAEDCSEHEQAEAFRLVNTDRRWQGEFMPAHEDFDQGRPVMLESLRNHRFNLFRCLTLSPRRPAASATFAKSGLIG